MFKSSNEKYNQKCTKDNLNHFIFQPPNIFLDFSNILKISTIINTYKEKTIPHQLKKVWTYIY